MQCGLACCSRPVASIFTHRVSRPLRRGYARAVINTGAISRSAERVRHCSFAAGVVAVGQDKSAQLLAKALRVLDTEKCDEKVARVALEFAAMESVKDVALAMAIKEAEMRSEGEIAVVRYKYGRTPPRRGGVRLRRQSEGADSRQGRDSAGGAVPHFRRRAARGRPHRSSTDLSH